ncbi:MAG: methyltransferase domain-containing protein [Thermomicrobiales bacterium]|nr:methyltransferase domain-containing protein [Thermomicrobiales bacterium]
MGETSSRQIRRSDEHYTPIASAYTTSAIHAQGADLARLVELAALAPGALVLDVGTGTGHTGLAFAAAGASIVGLDLTHAMLAEARALAKERGAALAPVRGAAELLPFSDATFDAVVCRYCAHHFMDVAAAIAEMARVVKPGGIVLLDDHVAPEDDAADEFINRLDWLRDPSHRREPRLSEYEGWFGAAGLRVTAVEHRRERIHVDEWFARARTTPERQDEARTLLATAAPELQDLFAITADPVGFDLHAVIVSAVR